MWYSVSDKLVVNLQYAQEIFVVPDATDKQGNSLGPAVLARMHGEKDRSIILSTFQTVEMAESGLQNLRGQLA